MGSVGSAGPAVERMDISKLTASQKDVMEKAYKDVELARTHSLDEWAMYNTTNGAAVTLEEAKQNYRPITNWEDYRYDSQEAAIQSLMKNVNNRKKNWSSRYEEDKKGIVWTETSSATLRALEKKGYIEILHDQGIGIDTVRIKEKRRIK